MMILISSIAGALSLSALLMFLYVALRRSDEKRLRLSRYDDGEAAHRSVAAMLRLRSEKDRHFLRIQDGFRPSLERRLLKQRRHAMKLFLQQQRGEFRRLMSSASEVARSADTSFGDDLVRLSMRFHVLYVFALYAPSLGGMLTSAPHEHIAGMVQRLRSEFDSRTISATAS